MSGWLHYDAERVESIASAMNLRRPNAEALSALAGQVAHGDGREVIADLATGVGKTYLAAGLIDYLAQAGVRNVLVVVPGATILSKTIRNFTPGDTKYVAGAEVSPLLVTAENFARGDVGDALHDPRRLKLFVFTVQMLVSPTVKASRRAYEDNENIGEALYSYLQGADDLVVIVDEHHVIREKAKRFNAAVHELGARAVVGLTATPDVADIAAGKVVYQYPLAAAIADRLVKVPVIVYRQDGRKDLSTQLADACLLRDRKEPVWAAYAEAAEVQPLRPVLFVVCQTIADANQVASELRRDDLLPGDGAVLVITGDSPDSDLQALERVEHSDSPVRAIVSVDKLKEGWDVKNVGVIVAFRALASDTLTEQILGRGLRLPFGRRTDLAAIDQVDIVAHESYATLLRNKDALLQRLLSEVKTTGSATTGGELAFTELHAPDPDDAESGFVVSATTSTAASETLDGIGAAEILLAQEMGAKEKQATAELNTVGEMMPRNPFPPIQFPTQSRISQPAKFTLHDVSMLAVEQQGRAFSYDPQVKLVRRAIDAHRDIHGELHVIDRPADSEDASRVSVSAEAIRRSLLGRILHSGLIDPDLTEQLKAVELVDAFLKGAGIDNETGWEWSVEHAGRAESALYGVIRAAHKGRQTTSSWRWEPVSVPVAQPKPTDVRGVWDAFVPRAWTGPWAKSIDAFAHYDSASAEWLLAQKLDTWDDVDHWQRLYTPGPAWIAWKGGRYHPDFVVVDAAGAHWVVEAKADKAAIDSIEVQEKAAAAHEWIKRVNGSKLYGAWAYRIVTEAQIAAAIDWKQLVR
ncbi:DEAD/DEAH box helicase family protein [Microbacterium enclense]|uniref:DEAD/DEAH box helicase family protein n=1 Tax=Microbacterium enclense TaxID=993073 RepID=UPI003F81031F